MQSSEVEKICKHILGIATEPVKKRLESACPVSRDRVDAALQAGVSTWYDMLETLERHTVLSPSRHRERGNNPYANPGERSDAQVELCRLCCWAGRSGMDVVAARLGLAGSWEIRVKMDTETMDDVIQELKRYLDEKEEEEREWDVILQERGRRYLERLKANTKLS